MNHNHYIREIEKSSFNKWVEIDDNIFVYKKRDGGIAVIHPNVSSFKKVSEWQSQCYRLVNGVKIDGVACTSSDQCEIRKVLLKELDFLSLIIVPEREE
jgi:hypothetical protein